MEISSKTCSSCGTAAPASGKKVRAPRAAKNPDHSASKKRINRIVGQLEAVSRMIDEQKYCPEILQQLRAASSALRSLEGEILRGHLRGCVAHAFQSKSAFDSSAKIEEIVKLWSR